MNSVVAQSNQSRAVVRRAQHRAVTHEITLSSHAKARTRRFAICNDTGEPVWHGRDSHDKQWAAELGAAKRAVALASRVAEREGVQRLRLNLIVSAEWLMWASSAVIIGGGRAQSLREAAHAAGIVLHVEWVRGRDNPASVRARSSREFLRWEDRIDQIEVVELLSQAGTRTTAVVRDERACYICQKCPQRPQRRRGQR